MHEVKIYGEVVPFQDAWVIDDGYVNLSYVQKQLEVAGGEDLLVLINSYGGDVDEGFAIYSELRRYTEKHNAKITTRTDGRCASIATVIFLAGDTRVVSPFVEPFVHNAWTYAVGDNKQIMRVAADLEKANNMIADHYAEHTLLTKEQALELMEAETGISPDECVKIKFATEIEEIVRPAALKKILTTKTNKMATSKKTEKGLLARIKKMLSVKNVVVFTSTNDEIEFPDVEEGQEPTVGDTAVWVENGEPVDGEHTLQDGRRFIFSEGELTEIIEEESEMEAGKCPCQCGGEIAELQKSVEALAGVVEKQNQKWNKLKGLISDYDAGGKDNNDKTPNRGGSEKNRLTAAISSMTAKN